MAIKYDIPLLHMATKPLSAGEVYEYVYGKSFVNELSKQPFNYNYRTKYAELFSSADGYIFSKERVLAEIKEFVQGIRA